MNTHVKRPALRFAAAMAALWLTILLIALGLLLLGCGGPTPKATPTSEPGTATPTVTPPSGQSTATPTPPPPSGPITACDAITISVLAARGSGDPDINFEEIAKEFAAAAQLALPTGTVVYGPEVFQLNLTEGMTFAQQMDQYTIGFYTGHGDPTHFDVTAGGLITPVIVSSLTTLGQCGSSTGGQLRYLILSSCNTLAHGPEKDCDDPNAPDYGCPGEWNFYFDPQNPGKDTEDMRSIYERWGPALDNGLRMVCGASTTLVPTATLNIWSNYGNNLSPADAILAALSNYDYVSLCLAKGGYEFAQSPLMADTTFTTTSNTYGHDYYHIQYAKPLTSTTMHGVLRGQAQELIEEAAFVRDISKSFPTCLPVIAAHESEPQSKTSATQYITLPTYATQYITLPTYTSEAEALQKSPIETDYINIAQQSFGRLGIDDKILQALKPEYAYSLTMMLAVFPVNPTPWPTPGQQLLRVTEKNRILTFPQWFRLDQVQGVRPQDLDLVRLRDFYRVTTQVYKDPRVAPMEDGQPLVRLLSGSLQVQLNVDQSPISVVNRWQPIGKAMGAERVRTPYEAFLRSLWHLYYREAYAWFIKGGDATKAGKSDRDVVSLFLDTNKEPAEQIFAKILPQKYGGDGQQPYRLESWTWGYAPVQLSKDDPPRLRFGYEFRFVPNEKAKAKYNASNHPPISVWVPGQFGEACPKK